MFVASVWPASEVFRVAAGSVPLSTGLTKRATVSLFDPATKKRLLTTMGTVTLPGASANPV